MAVRKTLSARTQLLHGVARARGATTGHLHRLADAQNARRHCGWCTVCVAIAVHADRFVLALHCVWPRHVGGWFVLRHQAGRHGHRGAGGTSHGFACLEKQFALGHCSRKLCGHLCTECVLPIDRLGRSCHWICGGSHVTGIFQCGGRTCRLTDFLWFCAD